GRGGGAGAGPAVRGAGPGPPPPRGLDRRPRRPARARLRPDPPGGAARHALLPRPRLAGPAAGGGGPAHRGRRRLLRGHPPGPRAARRLAGGVGLLVREKRPADAEAALAEMAGKIDPPRRALAVGQAQEALDRPDDAERTYLGALGETPDDVQVLSRLLGLYVRRDQPDRAEGVLVRLLGPKVAVPEEDVPELRRQLALAMTAPGRPGDRVEEALAVLRLNR